MGQQYADLKRKSVDSGFYRIKTFFLSFSNYFMLAFKSSFLFMTLSHILRLTYLFASP